MDLGGIPLHKLPGHVGDEPAGVIAGVFPREGIHRVRPKGDLPGGPPHRLGDRSPELLQIREPCPNPHEEGLGSGILADGDALFPGKRHILQDRLKLHPGRPFLPVPGPLQGRHHVPRKHRGRPPQRLN